MHAPKLLLIAGVLFIAGCGDHAPAPLEKKPPLVKTVALAGASGANLGLTGTVRARIESPLAFQVGGRIAKRLVNAGQTVRAGQALFELDMRDLEQGLRSAEADLAAAEAALATADADLARNRQLQAKNFISPQALERVGLLQREARTRRDSAAARLAQARNGLGYGRLQAPADGMLIDVIGEPGQVVSAGQTVALLAQKTEREIEVYFPEDLTPPNGGEVLLNTGTALPIKLREAAGALDVQGRTRRARYTILAPAESLVLGSVLHTRFAGKQAATGEFSVPVGALSERGEGARVWRVQDGHVAAVPVTVLGIAHDSARIRGPLTAGEQIVALGTHLLVENMAVRTAGQ